MGYYRVYIGRLPRDVSRREVEKLTEEFGRCVEISVHSGFAFVEFSHERSARSCVNTLDGERYAGVRIKAEPARSQTSGRWRDTYGGGASPKYHGGRYTRGDYRIIVYDLPSRVSWQDLKDLMRKAGEVAYTDIADDGSGIVEFSNSSDMNRALQLFDGYEFQGKIIRASEDAQGGYRRGSTSSRRRGTSSEGSASSSDRSPRRSARSQYRSPRSPVRYVPRSASSSRSPSREHRSRRSASPARSPSTSQKNFIGSPPTKSPLQNHPTPVQADESKLQDISASS